jgi:hypothetical protein
MAETPAENVLEVVRGIQSLFDHLAALQCSSTQGDWFVRVEYRARGEYLALLGMTPYGPQPASPVYQAKGCGAIYEQALIDLWKVVQKDNQDA